jgi:hypothetical protein
MAAKSPIVQTASNMPTQGNQANALPKRTVNAPLQANPDAKAAAQESLGKVQEYASKTQESSGPRVQALANLLVNSDAAAASLQMSGFLLPAASEDTGAEDVVLPSGRVMRIVDASKPDSCSSSGRGVVQVATGPGPVKSIESGGPALSTPSVNVEMQAETFVAQVMSGLI